MGGPLEAILGDRERFRPASVESWRAVEEWLGHQLPDDYKEFVDGYGDAVLLGHLFVPHPEGADPLLKFMREEQRYFQASFQDVRDIPQSLLRVWERIVPWAYHDWNGDVCLLVPSSTDDSWQVALAFRQNPGFQMVDGGVTEFLAELKQGRLPPGWPVREPWWQSMPDSPLI